MHGIVVELERQDVNWLESFPQMHVGIDIDG